MTATERVSSVEAVVLEALTAGPQTFRALRHATRERDMLVVGKALGALLVHGDVTRKAMTFELVSAPVSVAGQVVGLVHLHGWDAFRQAYVWDACVCTPGGLRAVCGVHQVPRVYPSPFAASVAVAAEYAAAKAGA